MNFNLFDLKWRDDFIPLKLLDISLLNLNLVPTHVTLIYNCFDRQFKTHGVILSFKMADGESKFLIGNEIFEPKYFS